MAGLEGVELRLIQGEELQAAALVAARGMRDNPLHVAAIGARWISAWAEHDPDRPHSPGSRPFRVNSQASGAGLSATPLTRRARPRPRR